MSSVVITGASRGIGRFAAQYLAIHPSHTHMVLLNRRTPVGLVDELRATGVDVSVIRVDLSSVRSVAQATDEAADAVRSGRIPPIRTLVCNAGVQHTTALTETVDGLEETFAVNVLANHLLLSGLRAHLTSQARVVVTVSDTHFGDLRHNLGMVSGPRWRPVETLARVGAFPNAGSVRAGRTAYSTSKLAAIHLVHEHARRFPDGPTVLAFNPGFVPGTDLAHDADALSRFAMRRVMPALTLTPLATSPARAGRLLADAASGATAAPSGAYIDRDRAAPSSPESYDPGREHQAWAAIETLIAEACNRPAASDPPRT